MASESAAVSVFSEIGPLRRVLVHAPGREVDRMLPSMMRELLFDDIVYGPRARREHGRFRAVLGRLGAEVLDTRDLLVEALRAAPGARESLIGEVVAIERSGGALRRDLLALESEELAAALVEGIEAPEGERSPERWFRLAPLANLLFTRDAQVTLGEEVLIASMSRPARRREPALARFLFERHPALAGVRVRIDFAREASASGDPTLEGGDVLVFREGVVVVGVSERTGERAVDRLVESLRGQERLRHMILVPMPRSRGAMHLDTIFTRISLEECLVFAPMVLPDGPEAISVIAIDLARPDDWGTRHRSLLEALRRVGVDLEPVPCGGRGDYITQAREQWTDGANSFAISPGVILVYGRNAETAGELARRGWEVVSTTGMEFSPEGDCLHRFLPGRRYAILVAGGELSRARGGPRCMTMPLERAEV